MTSEEWQNLEGGKNNQKRYHLFCPLGQEFLTQTLDALNVTYKQSSNSDPCWFYININGSEKEKRTMRKDLQNLQNFILSKDFQKTLA